jgi:IS605 OrfB family transposase
VNDFIEETHNADVDGIIFENLDHIRETMANGSKFQQWAYAKFIELVEYNVESTELFVGFVNPASTSQRCNHCGFTYEDNRDDKEFECPGCGYEVNGDYNTAKNITVRYCGYIHRGQRSRGGWATSQLALNSGAMNVNGDYTPADLLG